MPAMKHHGDRTGIHQFFEADELSRIIRQQKRRHRVPRRGCRDASFADIKPADQRIDRVGVSRMEFPNGVGVTLETLL